MLHALDFVRNLVLSGPETKDEETGFTPFLLDPIAQAQPGTFSLIFYIEGIQYEYLVCLDSQRILWEVLRFTPEKRIATLFSRNYDTEKSVSKLNFGSKCTLSAKERTILNGNTLENSTTLFAYQKSNIHSPVLDTVISYFRKNLMPLITPNHRLREWSRNRLEADAKQKQFFVTFLAKADFQIADLEIRNGIIPIDETLLDKFAEQGAPKSLLEKLKNDNQLEVKELLFLHATTQGTYQISSEDESAGTMRYFGLGGVLQQLIGSSHVAAIDELESSLHPDLVSFFLQMFLLNANNSQLIVTTHAQYLMEQDYMRNDMVWFCEKQDSGTSEYYSAQDFKLHKNNNLANFYQAGKLGAKPVLGSPLLGKDKQ
jgi:AAA15 family ATPase/GTPase